MIDDVIKAISAKINSFRDKATTKIYMEKTEQGFQEPCFFIKELRTNQDKELSNRYKRSHLYDIYYFPNSNKPNEEMRNISEKLYDELEFINVSGRPLMGLELNHQIIDGVLHFFVKYPMYLYKETEIIPKLEDLEYEGGIRIDEEKG